MSDDMKLKVNLLWLSSKAAVQKHWCIQIWLNWMVDQKATMKPTEGPNAPIDATDTNQRRIIFFWKTSPKAKVKLTFKVSSE